MPHAQPTEPEEINYGDKKFFVNDGRLRPEQVGYLKESSKDLPIEELRRRYHEDGYVFIKGLLPKEDVLKTREKYFKMLEPSGVLKPGTKPVEGIFDDEKNPDDFPGMGAMPPIDGQLGPDTAAMFVDLALQAHYEDWYKEDFCRHPVLMDTVAKLSGWGDNTMFVKRSLLRNNTPRNNAIGVHYDHIFIRFGEPTHFTAWVPIGDVSDEGGGLIYLEDAHTLGREIEAEHIRKHEGKELTDEELHVSMLSTGLLSEGPKEYCERFGKRWLAANYEAGDVVFHTPFTIHASTVNHDPKNSIRLGTDLRYVDKSKPYDKRWDNLYHYNDGV